MNTDLLTSPFFIWYGVVLILLYLAGSGLGKLADQKQKRQASQSRRTLNMTQLDIDASTASPMRRRSTSVVIVRADWRSDRSVWVSSSRELPHLAPKRRPLRSSRRSFKHCVQTRRWPMTLRKTLALARMQSSSSPAAY